MNCFYNEKFGGWIFRHNSFSMSGFCVDGNSARLLGEIHGEEWQS